MSYFLAFTDACPDENLHLDAPDAWHTLAGIGLLVEGDFRTGILSPDSRNLIRIPDPEALAVALQPAEEPFRDWGDTRGEIRKSKARARILAAARTDKGLFLSHSTRTEYAQGIADRYVARYCSRFIARSAIIGGQSYQFLIPRTGETGGLRTERFVSLVWVTHCLAIFVQKIREAVGNVEVVFVHDNLPGNRLQDTKLIAAMLEGQDYGRIHFTTTGGNPHFPPVDNLAAIHNEWFKGNQASFQEWLWAGGKPKNLCMTADDADTFRQMC